MLTFRWPRSDEHTSIIGQNGSGKTQLAAFILTQYDWSKRRGIIIDFKREPLFAKVKGIKQLGWFGKPPWRVPRSPGLYLVQPEPWEDDAIEAFLYAVWHKGNTLLYIDEAHMIPKQHGGALQALLTQGRSKHIQMIVLTQKPSWVSRFVFSEAKFFSVFYLQDIRDRRLVENFVPAPLDDVLQPYHSYWFDSGQRQLFTLQPVPAASNIIASLDERLPRQWWQSYAREIRAPVKRSG
jgi:hypothetical protein